MTKNSNTSNHHNSYHNLCKVCAKAATTTIGQASMPDSFRNSIWYNDVIYGSVLRICLCDWRTDEVAACPLTRNSYYPS